MRLVRGCQIIVALSCDKKFHNRTIGGVSILGASERTPAQGCYAKIRKFKEILFAIKKFNVLPVFTGFSNV
jgi:hypothetical protein